MKEHSKKRNIEETMDNSSVPQETVRPRADSFDSLGSFGLLLKKMPLPEEGEDIMFSPQELELKEIEAQFKSDMSNLKNNRNKKLFNLFASSLKNNDTETCKKIINPMASILTLKMTQVTQHYITVQDWVTVK